MENKLLQVRNIASKGIKGTPVNNLLVTWWESDIENDLEEVIGVVCFDFAEPKEKLFIGIGLELINNFFAWLIVFI